MVKLSLHIVGVEEVRDGVIIVLQQEKMQIPEAQDPLTDEAKMFKKIAKGMQQVGLNLEMMPPCPNNPKNFRTGLWFTMEDYEAMGKPTVGEMLELNAEKEKIQ